MMLDPPDPLFDLFLYFFFDELLMITLFPEEISSIAVPGHRFFIPSRSVIVLVRFTEDCAHCARGFLRVAVFSKMKFGAKTFVFVPL